MQNPEGNPHLLTIDYIQPFGNVMTSTYTPLLRLPGELLTPGLEISFDDHMFTIGPGGDLIPHALLRTCRALRGYDKLFIKETLSSMATQSTSLIEQRQGPVMERPSDIHV